MSKATKVFLILFVSVFTAGVAANIICEIFKTRLQKYYSVDQTQRFYQDGFCRPFSLQKTFHKAETFSAKFPTIRVKAHRAKKERRKNNGNRTKRYIRAGL